MKLIKPTKAKDISRSWHLIDMKGKILGRTATQISQLLMGKAKFYYTPNLDCGDYVVVINASSLILTGNKSHQKIYMRYSGYPAGLTKKVFADVINTDPIRPVKNAVSGMLPKNKLRALMLKRLYIFADKNHPYKEKLKI
ncbi:50S ribosomal protein L13 [Candidatus Gottesmanbacteria bacterium RIFCSPLOWO2_01_FULL_39_12b]|uniref:Large ribosomal subunit protein uL13 n=1 Tax=Candidatus Gottesmanbacteria bacterium RIFCSPLOWO2_01_FULL_39_12b TaxID=1798388 RepID=A0A1F6ANR7_9BACT|nr:MAG: 50S ribosomal protein L13 [Candidatus Gottesmanbacteria bacterium RIFCSPLOWO2_01_FULL_39_12b]